MALENQSGYLSHTQKMDFTHLNADSHLTKQERDIMNSITNNYEQNKENLTQAIKGELKNFIIKDYGEANRQYLGGIEGIVALQKALDIQPTNGLFGPETFHAVIDFQRKYGMKPDGIAGQGVQDRLGLIKDKNGTARKVTAIQESNGTNLQNSDKREFGRAKANITMKPPKLETSLDVQKSNPLIVGKIDTVKNLAINLQSDTYKDPEIHKTWKEVSSAMAFAGPEEEYNRVRFQDNRYKALNSAIKNLDSTMQGIDQNTPEYKYYTEIRASLIDLNMAWRKDGMSGGEKSIASLKGMGIGAYETVKGVFDITIFVGSLPFSPEKRNLVKNIWGKVSVACSTPEERAKAWNLFQEAVTKFYVEKLSVNSTMQPDEQGELAGKIFSYVMGGLGIGKGVVALTEKALSKGGKVVQAEEILGNLAAKGEVSGKRVQRIQELQNRAKYAQLGYKTLSITLNGVAESAVGASLMKTCKGVALVLSSVKEIPEKMAAVKDGIKQVQAEFKNPHLSTEQRIAVSEIQASLEGELRNLESNGVVTSNITSNIDIDGVEIIPNNIPKVPKKKNGDIVDVEFTMSTQKRNTKSFDNLAGEADIFNGDVRMNLMDRWNDNSLWTPDFTRKIKQQLFNQMTPQQKGDIGVHSINEMKLDTDGTFRGMIYISKKGSPYNGRSLQINMDGTIGNRQLFPMFSDVRSSGVRSSFLEESAIKPSELFESPTYKKHFDLLIKNIDSLAPDSRRKLEEMIVKYAKDNGIPSNQIPDKIVLGKGEIINGHPSLDTNIPWGEGMIFSIYNSGKMGQSLPRKSVIDGLKPFDKIKKVAPTKKVYDNLINPENYEQELFNLRTKRQKGEITQKEYREAQKELIMERALQRSNEMFLEGEKILRTHPDIKPYEMTQLLREHFKTNDIQLSRLQEAMIDSIPRVLQEAIDIRQKNLKIYFDRAGKLMPEKMEDVQRMLNEDLDVNFQLYKEVRYGQNFPDRENEAFFKHLYSIGDMVNGGGPVVDIMTHPTVIIKKVPGIFWNDFDLDGIFSSNSNQIAIKRGLFNEAKTIEHEYIHFLNSLTSKIIGEAQMMESFKRNKILKGTTPDYALSSASEKKVNDMVRDRLGRDAYGENYVHSKIIIDRFSESSQLWRSMQDELLAYLKGNNLVPSEVHGNDFVRAFLNGGQKRLLTEGMIPIENLRDMYAIQSIIFQAKNGGHIPDEELLSIIRTSGNMQIMYERLVRQFPEEFQGYPLKWDEYHINPIFMIRASGEKGMEIIPGIHAQSIGDKVNLTHHRGDNSFFRQTNAEGLSGEIDGFNQRTKKYGNHGLHEMDVNELSNPLFQSASMVTTIGDYRLFMNQQKGFFSISKGDMQVSYRSISEFVEGLKKFKEDPESLFPKEVSDFGSEVDTIIANGEKHTEKVIAELDGNFQEIKEELGKHFGSHGAIDDWEDIFGKLKVQKDGDVIYENGIVSRGTNGIVETIQHEGVILDFDKNGKVNDVIGGTALQLDDGSIEVTLKNGSKKVIPHEFIIGKKNS